MVSQRESTTDTALILSGDSARFRGLVIGWAIGFVALATPLIANLRGGGVVGVGAYDDGVYFAAATGLVHGRLPYRDFLLLHPPGIVVALVPSAWVGHIVSDSVGFLAARLAWLLMGSICAILVWLILRPLDRFAAVFAGLFFSVFYPAVYVAHTTFIETPQNLALLVGLWIIGRQVRERGTRSWRRSGPWLAAGLALGMSPCLKITGSVVVILVAGWVLAWFGWRRLVQFLSGVAITGLAVYLPFFLRAPGAMWRHVVVDQLDRGSFATSPSLRLQGIAGMLDTGLPIWAVVIVALYWLIALTFACLIPFGRIVVCVHLTLSAVLLTAPGYSPYYAGVLAPTAALVMGAAVAATGTVVDSPAVRRVGVGAALVVLLTATSALGWVKFGAQFPAVELASVKSASGCVTADDPTTLIRLDLLNRNLDRGCRLVVDLGGYTYDLLVDGEQRSRIRNPHWQNFALDYLGSGSQTVISRFTTSRYSSFTQASLKTLNDWDVAVRAGRYVVRIPER